MRHSRKPSDSFIQSFARGLEVIRSFGPDAAFQTLSEVSERTKLDRAGARRILLTLESLGYVARQDRAFYLTPRILELGYTYLSATPGWSVAQPIIERLARQINETSSLAILDGTDIVYLVRAPVQKIITINLAIGSRLPAYCTASGRVLLGGLVEDELSRVLHASDLVNRTKYTIVSIPELKRIILRDRAQGWSLIDQELELGLCSIAAPVIDTHGRPIAAISVGASQARTPPPKLVESILPQVKEAAKQISLEMGMRRGPSFLDARHSQ
jgi:IclR family transcriptional regulator, pca regulon regulatory protein